VLLLSSLLAACSAPPDAPPPEMEELTWMMLRDFDSDAIVEETELLAAWIDREIASPEEGYRVETPATAYVEDLTFSPNLELGNMSGGLVIRRVRGTMAAYAEAATEADQSFADSSYERWDRVIENGEGEAWVDGAATLTADDAIEKNGGFGIILPYPMSREFRRVELERGEVIVNRAVIYDEGWADESNGILGGFTIEVLIPDGDDTIWLNCTWTQVKTLLGDNDDFYTNQIIQGSTDVMIGTELHVAGEE
jgi:hypothetical protein